MARILAEASSAVGIAKFRTLQRYKYKPITTGFSVAYPFRAIFTKTSSIWTSNINLKLPGISLAGARATVGITMRRFRPPFYLSFQRNDRTHWKRLSFRTKSRLRKTVSGWMPVRNSSTTTLRALKRSRVSVRYGRFDPANLSGVHFRVLFERLHGST